MNKKRFLYCVLTVHFVVAMQGDQGTTKTDSTRTYRNGRYGSKVYCAGYHSKYSDQ